jgi:Phosphotransferase enzyme family
MQKVEGFESLQPLLKKASLRRGLLPPAVEQRIHPLHLARALSTDARATRRPTGQSDCCFPCAAQRSSSNRWWPFVLREGEALSRCGSCGDAFLGSARPLRSLLALATVLWVSGSDPETAEESLGGGVANAGAVFRRGDEVHRPAGPNAEAIHKLLRLVRARGFDGVPKPLSLDGGRERLEYLAGDVPVAPFARQWRTDRVLGSTAVLLRRFHDVTEGLDVGDGSRWSAELADPRGGEVICHNDVCPENVVFRDGVAVALLDFDYVAPGRRVYDLAQFAKMCCPLDAPANGVRIGLGDVDPFARLGVLADAYGLGPDRREFVEAIFDAVRVGEAFVRRHVEAGDPGFVAMWEDRDGEQRSKRRARWLDDNRAGLLKALG